MTDLTTPAQAWFAVRCVVHHANLAVYEERLTLWQSPSVDDAIASPKTKPVSTLAGSPPRDAGFAQAYELYDQPGHGAEIFSPMRESALPTDEYLTAFFDTGSERQRDSQA